MAKNMYTQILGMNRDVKKPIQKTHDKIFIILFFELFFISCIFEISL